MSHKSKIPAKKAGVSLPPPSGYPSWLDYAIATMDTRQVGNDAALGLQAHWPSSITREQMREAAQGELDALRGPVAGSDAECFAAEHGLTAAQATKAGAAMRKTASSARREGPLRAISKPADLSTSPRRKRVLLPEFEELMKRKPGDDIQAALDEIRGDT